MIDLKRVSSLSEKISKHLAGRRAKQKVPLASSDIQTARILNQEKDGCILYTWDDVADLSEGAVVTHFGLYEPASEEHQVVHIYNQRVYVATCSINQERTLMAFTAMSRDGEPSTRIEKYSAYLAEVKAPNPRVFSLNLERHTFLKVQFLYDAKSTEKETHMLVMLHRESIGLYRIPLGRVANGMVMKGQPNTEQIARKFTWCQWDGQNQQLFYIHHRKAGEGEKQALMSCVQFYSNAHYDHVLDVPLNFPFTSKSSGRSHYLDIPFHSGIPDMSVNACVLTQGNGTFCLCYQQYVCAVDRKKSSPLPRTSPLQRTSPQQHRSSPYRASSTDSEVETTDINYHICLVHHAKTLHGCVSSIPSNIVKKGSLHFSWLGDNILVMLPGYFVHLLNVSIEFEPCNHILLHNKTVSSGVLLTEPNVEDQSQEVPSDNQTTAENTSASVDNQTVFPLLSLMAEHLVFLSTSVLLGVTKESSGNYLLEKNTGVVYKVQVNLESLVQTFADCYMPMTRSALLHYAILKNRHFGLLKKLFLILCNDVTSSEVPSLMTEYLTAMTYARMRRQADRDVLHLLPFTHIESFRGQFDKTPDGDRLARVSYAPINSINIVTKTAKERHQKKGVVIDDMLDTLRRHLRLMQINNKGSRLSLETLKKTHKQMEERKDSRLQDQEETEEESFLALIRLQRSRTGSRSESATVAMGNYDVKSESVLGVPPLFLQGSTSTEASEKLLSLTRDVLCKHLSMYLYKDARVKAVNIAKEYASCQRIVSRQLCHLLWSLRGPQLYGTDHDRMPNLMESGSLEEYELFQLMERYSLCIKELAYPVPQGFPSYFTALAYRCLRIREWMQYVSHGVLQITGDFMSHVLSDLPDDEEHVTLKHYIISKLPPSSAEVCYKQWGHASCNSYLAHQQVNEILSDATQRGSSDSITSDRRQSTSLQQDIQAKAVICQYKHLCTLALSSRLLGEQDTCFRNEQRKSAVDDVTFQPLTAFLHHLNNTDGRYRSSRNSPLDVALLEEVALHHTSHETNYDMGTVNF